MRLRGILSFDCVNLLHRTINQLSRLGKVATIILDESSVRIIVKIEHIDCPKCFVDLNVSALFLEYRIESQSDNTISFEIGLDNFERALGTGMKSHNLVLKLVKRGNQPCLTCEAKEISSFNVSISHDIPINLVRIEDGLDIEHPQISPPTVALSLLQPKVMRNIVEKMCKFSKDISIIAKQKGDLEFRVEQSACVVKTRFEHVQACYEGHLTEDFDSENEASVTVESRKLSSVLSVWMIESDSQMLCKLNPLVVGVSTLFISVVQI